VNLSSYKVGQELVGGVAKIRDGVTTPPKLFTDGDLIEVMGDIGRYMALDAASMATLKSRGDGKHAGIGTARTRDAIITGLFDRDYIEHTPESKKRKLKYIRPTEKGIATYTLLSEIAPQLVSPEMTARWEEALAMIESGAVTVEQFVEKNYDFCRKIVADIKSAPSRWKKAEVESLPGSGGACPKCKKGQLVTRKVSKQGSSVFGKRFLTCSDRDCGHREGDFVE